MSTNNTSSTINADTMNLPPAPTLAHTLNSRGELGAFVNPYDCSCHTCQDFVADRVALFSPHPPATRDSEPIGLSNQTPELWIQGIPLERQIGVASGSPANSPLSLPTSPSLLLQRSISGPIYLPQRSDCYGISSPGGALSRSDTNYNPALGPSESYCGTDAGIDEKTGMSLELHEQISEHLLNYLTLLEKQRAVLDAKLELYSELFDDASPRLRVNHLNEKIAKVKDTLSSL